LWIRLHDTAVDIRCSVYRDLSRKQAVCHCQNLSSECSSCHIARAARDDICMPPAFLQPRKSFFARLSLRCCDDGPCLSRGVCKEHCIENAILLPRLGKGARAVTRRFASTPKSNLKARVRQIAGSWRLSHYRILRRRLSDRDSGSVFMKKKEKLG
jgi:hypothetical protein